MEPDEISRSDVESLEGNSVWMVIKEGIERRIQDCHLLVESAPTDDIWSEEDGRCVLKRAGIKRVLGELNGLRYVMELFNTIKGQVEGESDES